MLRKSNKFVNLICILLLAILLCFVGSVSALPISLDKKTIADSDADGILKAEHHTSGNGHNDTWDIPGSKGPPYGQQPPGPWNPAREP